MTDAAFLQCIQPSCSATFALDAPIYQCPTCGALLDVSYNWSRIAVPSRLADFEKRWASRHNTMDYSGVWRFRELLPFATDADLVTIGEGQTILQSADAAAMGLSLKRGNLHLQYEGMNPSGSFKDNGMTAAFTMARKLGKQRVGCASTGNTSASLAMYASLTRLSNGQPMRGVVFVGAGKIAFGKLSQALDYGALTLQIDGDFDACMARVREAADRIGLYLMNSINPFRLEGQKTIMYRVLEALRWEVPDWIVVPGGNLGNTSAFGKAWIELKQLGLVSRIPRLAVVNAAGANTLNELVNRRGVRWNGGNWDCDAVCNHYDEMTKQRRKASTIATAIEIARPVNLSKALRALDAMNGVVCEVTDDEILEEKALVGRHGFGCEPASAASVAGLRQLLANGTIDRDATVVCILTGHALKDPDATVKYHTGIDTKGVSVSPSASKPTGRNANLPIRVPDNIDEICKAIESAR
ncbi:MAG: threonine synthase [Planctomycetes bacterium]|nr:threonine synthase [Planctomycetota bacterium]